MTAEDKRKIIYEQIEIIRAALLKLWLTYCEKEND